MASKTGSRLFVAALVVGAGVYLAPKAVDTGGTFLGDLVGATDAVIMGEGDTALMVAVETEAKLVNCAPASILADRRCGDLRILVVDATKMPFIARNTKLAWESGRPAVLTMNRGKIKPNRGVACPKSFPTPHDGQCDEYPMASTEEGGDRARTEEVPARENQCQGGSYGAQYPPNGQRFLVVIGRPDLVASGPFTGSDIAKAQGRC
jgi:hypothetical protein